MEVVRTPRRSETIGYPVRFETYLDDQLRPLEVTEAGSRVTVIASGNSYEADVISISPGQYSILFAGKVFDVHVDNPREGEFQVAFRDHRVSLELIDPRKMKSLRHRHTDSEGEAAIVSPMPGKVVRLLVREGQTVEPGQGLIVIEAMKMQNEMKSPKAGVVKSVNTQEGKTVNAGEELLVIE